ncbi:MAG: hypothetical protein IH912_07210 [Proteobacteria bacterium]|nr:hypothetical protein [Pseudomonadota bacterium]MCH8302526.1 hypothetical protein [Pseudomonadota bacterium]
MHRPRLAGYAIDQDAAPNRDISAVRIERRGDDIPGAGSAKNRAENYRGQQSIGILIYDDSPAAIGSEMRSPGSV